MLGKYSLAEFQPRPLLLLCFLPLVFEAGSQYVGQVGLELVRS